MARRVILGKNGSDYGLFVSEPGTNVDSITNVKDFAFTTSGGTGNTGMNKASTFSNRGISYLKTSSTFKVTAMGNFFL